MNDHRYETRGRQPRAGLVTAVIIGMILLLPGMAMAVNPNSGATTTGQPLNIQIDTPSDGAIVPASTDLGVTGKVAIGTLSTDANVLYVVDVSGSTGFPSGQDCDGSNDVTGDNFNGDGTSGDTLDCEISGVLALNDSLSSLTGVDVGAVPFGSSAIVADVGPAGGQQNFTTPTDNDDNSNGIPDIEEVVRSMDQGSVSLFTQYFVGGSTNFDAALASMNSAFGTQPAGEDNVAFFLSDGVAFLATGPGTPLQAAVDAGTTVNTYSVGSGSTGCGVGADLRIIADQTGGTCTEVVNPADLSAALGGATPAGIDKVEVSFDGGAPVVASLDALGNFATTIPGALLTTGTHTIAATVFASDGTQVTADIEVVVEGSTATVNVVKLVDSEPDGVFDDDASGWTFQVRKVGAGLIDSAVTAADGMLTFEVDPGDDYRVRESDGPAGMWWASWSCVDDDSGSVLATGSGLFPVATNDLDLVSDQSVTCTFENQLMAGFMTGGGQITDDNDGDLKRKDLERISFGGNVGIRIDGTLHGQWQANLHNVSDDTLDKGNFHSTSIDLVLFRDLDGFEDPAPPEALWNFIRFDATGRFNGVDGWSVTVRATDTGEPGNGKNAGDDTDSMRIQLYDPAGALVYDSQTDFPAQQQGRHELDHGNIQIHMAD